MEKETLRLQSIYAYDLEDAGKEMLVNFSAPKGGKIEFRDSIYINVDRNSASAFHLNNWYINDDEEKVAQTGDIIFTGEDATAENLKAILAEHGIRREATADEIRLSKTSEVSGTMQLHDGRLIVRDRALIKAVGITVHGSASGESTPTLWLDNGELSSYTRKNAVTISGGSALRLSGKNTVRNSTLTLSAGSTFIIDVAAAHTTTAALTLNSSTLSLGGTITLQLNAAEGLNIAGRYMLLSGVSAPTDWASNITVSGGVWTIDDLSWVNNILYLNFPILTEATWNNQSGDRLWNVNSSVNWEQHDIDYAYKDGIGVIFGDEGAGKVTLVGTITPASVLVNSTGNYSFEGSGSLSGGMTLTKQGSGTLSISTANSYTGGTMIEAGTVVAKHAAALGTGMVTLAGGTLEIAVTGVGNIIANTGTSTLKVANGRTHGLTGTIANSGELTLSGVFQTSGLGALSTRAAATYENAAGVVDSTGGFSKSAIQGIQLTSGSGTTVNSLATIWHGTDKLTLGSDGWATMGGEVSYGSYYIGTGHEVELSAIVNKAAENQVSTTDIQLNGGKLTANRAMTGTLSISGTSTLHGVDFNLGNAPLQNNGDLTLTGSFDASGLSKSKTWNSYVTTSNEVSADGSGFLREGDFEVTVVTGTGTVDSSGVIAMKYGSQNLTMDGAIGTGVGAMQYDTYRILSGHEVELSDIVNKAADNQVSTTDIQLNGGKLTADRALTGTLSISGTSELHGVDFNLGNAPLQNNGDLTLTGSFDASGLSKSK
ncbi:MAG: autotransporter-associated beta strand repeat-containing protein, partial [Akkermansia sp.]|nr:autotransporter-associated beta strand repeat-containing protein [Akkermansia sp.]